jgi:hypothetical protein
MSLALARWHVTQSTAVASYQAESIPLPVTVTTTNVEARLGQLVHDVFVGGL